MSGNISVKVIGSVKKLCKCVYIVYEYPLCNSKEEKFENICIKKITLKFLSATGFEPTDTIKL